MILGFYGISLIEFKQKAQGWREERIASKIIDSRGKKAVQQMVQQLLEVKKKRENLLRY